MSEVTRILNSIGNGDPKAAEELLPLVYGELRKLAAQKMAAEKSGQTLQPTALVHEAWLRLSGNDDQSWDNSGHFFKAAAESMRRILIENARRKQRQRHGGGLGRLNLDDVKIAINADDDSVLALNDALEKLADLDSVKAELVKLRFFAGMSNEEAAQALGLSVTTVKRYWTFTRAWLFQQITEQR